MDIKNIENIYSLSHLQQAILLKGLYSRETGFYCGQVSFKWLGELDFVTLEKSWQRLVECYPVLRTIFLWENLDQPQQIVQKQVKISLEQQDWLSLSSVQQEKELEDFLNSDRDKGFEPVQAPLVRLTVCQLSENSHQFVFSYHPLVLDDWSANLILEQIFECYDDFSQGQQWQPKANPPYRDYMAWLKSKDTAKTEQFWTQVLQGFTASTQIPVKQIINREGEQSNHYGEQSLQLSPDLTKQLQSLLNEQHLNLNTLIQGAWAFLLSRYSGQDDVVFGQTTSIRPPELENSDLMVGPLTNTLPMGVHIVADKPVLNWLKELQNQAINQQQYGYSSLMQIQGLNHLPLFDSQVVLNQKSPANFASKYGETKQISDIKRLGAINFPITVTADFNPQLTLQITYNRRQFDGDVIRRMLDHMKTLLEGMVNQLEQPLSKLTILSESEREQLLTEWNQTKTDYPEDKCIHQLFEEQVQLGPDNVAVVWEEQQLTYQQLNERANQLGNYLSNLGVGPEVPVAISLDRSLEMIVGLLGILKAGGAYVPLDPTYPFERLSFLLDDVQPPVLLTRESLVDELPSHWGQVICLDSDWEEIAQESQENPSSGVTPKNLAYIIHTSGSTGTPKGVMLEHLGLCNLATAQIKLFDVNSTSRVLQFASLSFDASIWEIVMALSAGARLCLGTWDTLLPGSPLLLFLQKHAITHSTLPPSALSALPREDLPALQTIIVAGEACSPELIERWSSGRRFFNAYGPTEATVCATVARCSDSGSKPPIGRPINNTQVFILDHHLQPVPVGVPGELHIGGVGLARGYLNRSELTEKKFIVNPFSEQPESRLYKTGDLARYLPDGKIEFLDRIDHQVKIRGFRIELGEIESVLSEHSNIKEVAVINKPDQTGNQRLEAYLVPTQEQAPSAHELRSFLKQKLPDYMVPSAFEILENMPLTMNGKIDRQALLTIEKSEKIEEAKIIEPRNQTEAKISKIWLDILKLEAISVEANFFEIGGDSLLATQVINRLNEAFSIQLNPTEFFEEPKIADIAPLIDKKVEQSDQTTPSLSPIPRVSRRPVSGN